MKNKITAIVFCIVLIGGTGLNIWGNIIHTSSEFSDSEFSLPLVGEIFDYIKENESQNIRGKTSLAFFSTAVQGYMGKKYIYDPGEDVVKLNNGHLSYGTVRTHDGSYEYLSDYTEHAEILHDFKDRLNENGTGLLYVQVPSRVPDWRQHAPYSAIECTNIGGDEFLEYLEDDIRYLKVSEEIEKAGLDSFDLFYKTDHHWNAECGFFVSQKIKEALNYTTDENVCDPDAYTKKR